MKKKKYKVEVKFVKCPTKEDEQARTELFINTLLKELKREAENGHRRG